MTPLEGFTRRLDPSISNVDLQVRQGNPISPILFNLAMKRVLKTLPQRTGIQMGTEKMNHLAFADDVVLLAKTDRAPGLNQQTGDRARKMWPLSLNAKKCSTLDTVPRDRQIVINPSTMFGSRAGGLTTMTAESFYKFLSIQTWSHGTKTNFIKKLERKLDDLRRAPLKPQQRIGILQTYCIPSLYHQIVLTKTTKQVLGGLDRVIRGL